MVIPTAGRRSETLEALIRDCGLPAKHVVIVVTTPGVNLPSGVVRVEDFGPINIQRWWTVGIQEAQRLGADTVAVLNDDMWISPTALIELRDELHRTGAAVASPSRPGEKVGLHKGRMVPYGPKLWGCFWVVRLESGLLPDDRYVWWYGDHDLDIRARLDFGGVVTHHVEWEHLNAGEGTGASAELVAQTHHDALTFQRDYARHLTLDRWAKAPKRWWRRVAGPR